jgi:signal transduction histidine kinase
VVLQRFGKVIQLAVIDNGAGFDTAASGCPENRKSGLGLASMRERARVSGGSYLLESNPGVGTSIFVSWYRED